MNSFPQKVIVEKINIVQAAFNERICTFLKCCKVSGLRSHISMMSVTPVINTPVRKWCHKRLIEIATQNMTVITMILVCDE